MVKTATAIYDLVSMARKGGPYFILQILQQEEIIARLAFSKSPVEISWTLVIYEG